MSVEVGDDLPSIMRPVRWARRLMGADVVRGEAILRIAGIFTAGIAVTLGLNGCAGVASPDRGLPANVSDANGCGVPRTDGSHWYVGSYQCGREVDSVSAVLALPNPRPNISVSAKGFSSGVVALEEVNTERNGCSRSPASSIRVSWVLDQGAGGGPYLRVGRTVSGHADAADAAPSADWHAMPGATPEPFPASNDALGADAMVELGIAHSGENGGEWQVTVNGDPVGYFGDATWPGGFHPMRSAEWGEVGSEGPDRALTGPGPFDTCRAASSGAVLAGASCSWMGDGTLGGGTAGFSDIHATGVNLGAPQVWATNPQLYSADALGGHAGPEPLGTNGFRYGGPGECVGSVKPQSGSIPPWAPISVSAPRRQGALAQTFTVIPPPADLGTGCTSGVVAPDGRCEGVKKRHLKTRDKGRRR